MKFVLFIGIIWLGCVAVLVDSYTCTAAGRYVDDSDTTCSSYVLCVLSGTTYIQYNYTCPTTSIFNNATGLCTDSANYNCTLTNSTDTTDSVCTEDGYVADSNSTDCSTYIQCVEVNGTFTETTLTCPNDTYFNPNTTLCEEDYNCTDTTDTEFTCTSAGRFANDSVDGCKSYYYCVYLSSTASYVLYTYECPNESVFNPDTSVCTTSYTCTT